METANKGNKNTVKFPFSTETITEGDVVLTIPRLDLYAKGPFEYIPSKAPVFYNPLMRLNRDVAVIALRAYQKMMGKNLLVCDLLTGCGVRGLRFAREVKKIEGVVLNDLNPRAVELSLFNLEINELSNLVIVKNQDANALLSNHTSSNRRFDVIDIDPYGSPVPFLDSAVRALRSDGLIALTATDMAVLCGINNDVCIRKYLGKSMRVEYSHELAIRLLINALVFSSARHEMGVNILFSHRTDHYIRIYAQICYGATEATASIKKSGYILHCHKCLYRRWIVGFPSLIDARCEMCGGRRDVAGPLWLGDLLDYGFSREMLSESEKINVGTERRVLRLLRLVVGEVDAPPTYYVIDRVCKKLGLSVPPKQKVICRLIELGYKATSTHFNPLGVKSNASIEVFENVIREVLKE